MALEKVNLNASGQVHASNLPYNEASRNFQVISDALISYKEGQKQTTSSEKNQSTILSSLKNGILWVKDWIVGIFRKIFFCCYSSNKTDPHVKPAVDILKELQAEYTNLRTFFRTERDKDKSEDKEAFKKVWKEKFDALPEEMRKRLCCKELESIRLAKLLQGDPSRKPSKEELMEAARKDYENPRERERALSGIRDLRLEKNEKLKYRRDPVVDDEVPARLQAIIDEIAAEIEQEKRKK